MKNTYIEKKLKELELSLTGLKSLAVQSSETPFLFEWIDYTKAKPPEDGSYFCVYAVTAKRKKKGISFIQEYPSTAEIIFYSREKGWSYYRFERKMITSNVTHWAFLPKVPCKLNKGTWREA